MLRRLFIATLLAAFVAMVSVVAAGAVAAYNLTLVANPNPVATLTSATTFSGTLTLGGTGVSGATIFLEEFTDSACSTESVAGDVVGTNGSGDYSDTTTIARLATAPYFRAFYDDAAASPCIRVGVGVQMQVNSVFLCYSKFQVQPGVWSADEAVLLMQAGYWQPTAVDGNITGGTNVGKYNLQCNVTPKGDGFVDANGVLWPPNFAPAHQEVLGYYPH